MNILRYGKDKITGSFDVIMIGSGIGGLGAAAILAREGKKVLVLEQHDVPGGFTHTFSRKGLEWDVGLHYVGEVGNPRTVLSRLFQYITDGSLEWASMGEVYDRAVFGDFTFDFVTGKEALRDKLVAAFPSEKTAIDGYLKLVLETSGKARSFFGQKALPGLVGRVAYPFMAKPFLKWADRTTFEVLSSLTQNRELIGVLATQYGDYGLPPRQSSFAIHALVARHYFQGGYYPVGGSSRLAEAIIPVIEATGGAVAVKACVEEILVRAGRAWGVRLTGGEEIMAPTVISDAGALNTFAKLLPSGERPRFQSRLQTVRASCAHVCLYLGFNANAAALELPRYNYWVFPDYDHDGNIERFMKDQNAPFPVVYISFPSAKDPSWEDRHPGTSTVEMVAVAPYEQFQPWEQTRWKKRGEGYEKLKEDYTRRLMGELDRFFPHLKNHLKHSELSTPLSTRHFSAYEKGEIYGLDHTPERFRQRWLQPRTPINNLYLTGQDVVTDGIGGALFGGLLTASSVLNRNCLNDILRQDEKS